MPDNVQALRLWLEANAFFPAGRVPATTKSRYICGRYHCTLGKRLVRFYDATDKNQLIASFNTSVLAELVRNDDITIDFTTPNVKKISGEAVNHILPMDPKLVENGRTK